MCVVSVCLVCMACLMWCVVRYNTREGVAVLHESGEVFERRGAPICREGIGLLIFFAGGNALLDVFQVDGVAFAREVLACRL